MVKIYIRIAQIEPYLPELVNTGWVNVSSMNKGKKGQVTHRPVDETGIISITTANPVHLNDPVNPASDKIAALLSAIYD